MLIDRRRFLALSVAATAAACAKTNDAGTGYGGEAGTATTGAPAGGPPSSPLPPPATTPRVSGTTRPAIEGGGPSSTTTSSSGSNRSTSTQAGNGGVATGPARFIDTGPATAGALALTFHTNGDLRLAQRMLDIAKAHNAVFTNFIVGNWLDANPSWGKKLLDGGHELANHTYTHPNFLSLGAAAMDTEIARCRDAIARVTGDGGRFFRPSGTDDGTAQPPAAVLAAAARAGYGIVLGFDVDPLDYKDPGAAAVQQRTLAAAKAGSIVSLHFGHQGTADALDAVLGGLADKGLRTVTVSQLLGA